MKKNKQAPKMSINAIRTIYWYADSASRPYSSSRKGAVGRAIKRKEKRRKVKLDEKGVFE